MSCTFLSLFIHLNVILVNVRTKSAAQLGNVIILITVRIEAVLEKNRTTEAEWIQVSYNYWRNANNIAVVQPEKQGVSPKRSTNPERYRPKIQMAGMD